MDAKSKDLNGDTYGGKKKPVTGVDSQKAALNGQREEDNESESLLPSPKGGLSRKLSKPRRKVQWNDKNGNKLAEVMEFQPSDESDSDDEDSDYCICIIM